MTIKEASKTRCERIETILAVTIGGVGIAAAVVLWGLPAYFNLIVHIGA